MSTLDEGVRIRREEESMRLEQQLRGRHTTDKEGMQPPYCDDDASYCNEDDERWPCLVIRALDAAAERIGELEAALFRDIKQSLAEMEWLDTPDGIRCPYCGSTLGNGHIWNCPMLHLMTKVIRMPYREQ